MVVRTLAFMILRQVLSLVRLGPSPDAKDIEIAVLRHQLMVLRRQVARPRYTPSDRTILATLAKLLPRDRWPIFLVTPSTLLRWHREVIRRRGTYPTNGRRRGLDPEVVDLVLRLARENRRWRYLRIVGECRKLGVRVSATSVRTILRRHRLGPAPRRGGPTWTQFLRSQAAGTLACDLLTIETIGLTRLYVFFIIELDHRRVHLAGITAHPTGTWVSQVARNLVMDLDEHARRFHFLIRDRDSKFTSAFDTVFAAAGIQVLKTPPRAPTANAFAELEAPRATQQYVHHRRDKPIVAHVEEEPPARRSQLALPDALRPAGDDVTSPSGWQHPPSNTRSAELHPSR